jgi:multiple sugar transport system substrate-binding protein
MSTCIRPQGRTSARLIAWFAGVAAVALASLQAMAQEPVKLHFWDMIWGPPQYIDAAKGLVDEFNKSHPDIQVEYRSVPWNNWYQTFLTAIGSGTAPDLSTGAGYQAVQLYDQGAIRPLDELIDELKKDGQYDDFQPGTIDTLRYDNHYVALPWGIDIRVWYYRKDLLAAAGQQPPATWAEFEKVAKATTGNGKYGLVAGGDTGGSHYIYSAILNNGGALFAPDRKLTLTSDRNVEAIEAYEDMVKAGSVDPASAGYTQDDARAAFDRGEAAFLLDTPGVIDSAGPAKSQIGIVPPLKGPHGDKGTIFWVNNIMVYQQSKHPEDVKTFLKWWSQNQKPLWTKGTTGQLPVRKSIASDPYFTNNAALAEIIKEYVPIGKTTATAATGIFPALNDLEGEGSFQAFAQQLWQGKPLKEILGATDARLKAVLKD